MADAGEVERHIDGELDTHGPDAVIAALAERQHGVVGRAQLEQLGLGRGAVERRLERRRLHAVHRGVYAVGHPVLKRQGRWMAAVLAAGPGAVLSHRSAGALWALAQSTRIEVTAPTRRSSRPRLIVRCAPLPDDEVTVVDGVPVTTVPRTLLDLATVLRPAQVERAINEAEVQRHYDALSLPALLARYPGRKGTRAVRTILERRAAGSDRQRSELEVLFVEFLDEYGLPRPAMNAHVDAGGRLYECDCVWWESRLIVELDSRQSHNTGLRFEKDRSRDRAVAAAGWRVIRITWRQLHDDRAAVAGDLSVLLSPVRAATAK